ncbi:hypothetical protein [Gordonia malaquae]|uniref:hypothetical protein n=1 Tax=Gordonia malaquae TaxID=410332 RepID=UPI0030FE3E62
MDEPADEPGRRDTEKRWGDADQARAPLIFLAVVVTIELAVLVGFVKADGATPFAVASPTVLGIAGLSALGLALRAYRLGRSWVQWQGVGWLLLVTSLAATALPLGAFSGAAA